jgi:hypothetical protein
MVTEPSSLGGVVEFPFLLMIIIPPTLIVSGFSVSVMVVSVCACAVNAAKSIAAGVSKSFIVIADFSGE